MSARHALIVPPAPASGARAKRLRPWDHPHDAADPGDPYCTAQILEEAMRELNLSDEEVGRAAEVFEAIARMFDFGRFRSGAWVQSDRCG
jgi:hypothetical protein